MAVNTSLIHFVCFVCLACLVDCDMETKIGLSVYGIYVYVKQPFGALVVNC